MAKIDITPADYWHIELAGNRLGGELNRSLNIFPDPEITYKGGIFKKRIRAVHRGNPVTFEGQRIERSTLENKFPSRENVPGLVNYSPVGIIGFQFQYETFSQIVARSLMDMFKESQFTLTATSKPYQTYKIIETGLWTNSLISDTKFKITSLQSSQPSELEELKQYRERLKSCHSGCCSELRFARDPKETDFSKYRSF